MTVEKKVINDEDEERDFRAKFKSSATILIKKEEPKGEDYKGQSGITIFRKAIPKGVYIAVSLAVALVLFLLSEQGKALIKLLKQWP